MAVSLDTQREEHDGISSEGIYDVVLHGFVKKWFIETANATNDTVSDLWAFKVSADDIGDVGNSPRLILEVMWVVGLRLRSN
eukprot:CAMPEP_0196652940 /NCGR_PEP_ID=MMETSP1086-20130531/2445_1 /TAXON_ID=77921 /ORGANISM="Cyanoptyche  gloeocystis , Strain SAG4.97" /LENGTH=81 /DNA_ID=CAMNT_0041983815 /DNA_START=679 /DNA_END=924 /DNA_ORIENTATION=+